MKLHPIILGENVSYQKGGKRGRKKTGKHATLVGTVGGYNCRAHYLANTEISKSGSCLNANRREMLAEHILRAFPSFWILLPTLVYQKPGIAISQQCYKADFFSPEFLERD